MAGIVFPALLLFLEVFFFKTGKAPASTNGKTPFVFTGFFLYFCIAALEAAILCTCCIGRTSCTFSSSFLIKDRPMALRK
jgi:hypothetical protein